MGIVEIFHPNNNTAMRSFYRVTFVTGLPMGKPSPGLRFVCLFSFFSFF